MRAVLITLALVLAVLTPVAAPLLAQPGFPAPVHRLTVPGNKPTRIVTEAAGALAFDIGAPVHGTVVRTDQAHVVLYLPKPGFAGTDSFTVTARDEAGRTAVQRKELLVLERGGPVYPAVIVGAHEAGLGAPDLTLLVARVRAALAEADRLAASIGDRR